MSAKALARWQSQVSLMRGVMNEVVAGWVVDLTAVVCEYIRPWPKNSFVPVAAVDVYPGSVQLNWERGEHARRDQMTIDDQVIGLEVRVVHGHGVRKEMTQMTLEVLIDDMDRKNLCDFYSRLERDLFQTCRYFVEIARDPIIYSPAAGYYSQFEDLVIAHIQLQSFYHDSSHRKAHFLFYIQEMYPRK